MNAPPEEEDGSVLEDEDESESLPFIPGFGLPTHARTPAPTQDMSGSTRRVGGMRGGRVVFEPHAQPWSSDMNY